jgi:hypothetical protein
MAVATETELVETVPRGLYIDGDWLQTPNTLTVEDAARSCAAPMRRSPPARTS